MFRRLARQQRKGRQGKLNVSSRLCLENLEQRLVLSGDAVLRWNSLLLQANMIDATPALRTGSASEPGPTLSSRAAAIVQAAVYDAVNSIDGSYAPYLINVAGAANANVDAAVAQAAHDTLVSLYPHQQATFDAALVTDLAAIPAGPARDEGVSVGQTVASRILTMRAADGATATADYIQANVPGRWETFPGEPSPLGVSWGQVTPFGMDSPTEFQVPPPPALNSPEYAAAYNEVKSLGGDGTSTPTQRTPEQTEIGIFWSYDGTPGLGTPIRLYDQIAQVIATKEGNTEVQNARMFFLANAAMADAGIAVWFSKYVYNFWRPVRAIRQVATDGSTLDDGNPATTADPTWTPLGAQNDNPQLGSNGQNFTPPFPSYTSGHAGFGAALFQTLTDFYGTGNIPFDFTSDEFNGVTRDAAGNVRPVVTRHYDTLQQAAAENGRSRVYLGVHYEFDNQMGQMQGRGVATMDFSKLATPVLKPNEIFINEVYRQLLGRRADSTGLTLWAGLLDQGTSRTQIVQAIENSAEYRNIVVSQLYVTFLQRAADASGLGTFTSMLASGATIEQVQSLIVGSAEYFQTRGGGTNDGFLSALYQDTLHRGVDSSGQAFFSQQLANGVSRNQVAAAIFGSGEYQRDLVDSYYQTFLQRNADSGGEAAWVALLQQGMTDQQLIAGFLGSDEFFNKQ